MVLYRVYRGIWCCIGYIGVYGVAKGYIGLYGVV